MIATGVSRGVAVSKWLGERRARVPVGSLGAGVLGAVLVVAHVTEEDRDDEAGSATYVGAGAVFWCSLGWWEGRLPWRGRVSGKTPGQRSGNHKTGSQSTTTSPAPSFLAFYRFSRAETPINAELVQTSDLQW